MDLVPKEQPKPVADLNIDNLKLFDCKHTTVGTHVNCQGFTVNQFLKVGQGSEPTNLQVLKDLLVKDTTKKFSWRSAMNWKIILLSIFLVGFVAGTTVTSIKLIKDAGQGEDDDSDDDSDELPMNYTARLDTRGDWSANERDVENKPLVICPAKFVVVAHTAGPSCEIRINCENIVKGIQNYHFQLGYGDIGYHFLIGGDGNIYEGLGWGKYGAHTYGLNCDSIGIAFIGDYNYLKLRKRSVNAFNLLIKEGVSIGEIAKDYKLFAQSQILNADSPGLHIKETIKTWSNYSPVEKEDFICLSDAGKV